MKKEIECLRAIVAAVEAVADEYHEKYGLGDHKRSYIADELFADLRAVLAKARR